MKIFPELPPWRPLDANREDIQAELLSLAGEMFGLEGQSHPELPAGYTLFGQFVEHDVTFHSLVDEQPGDNHLTPALDLDCVYGFGRRLQPHMFTRLNPSRFLLGWTRDGEIDLPRNCDMSRAGSRRNEFEQLRTALIADPRNDETLLIGQLHLAFLRAHNRLIDDGSSFEDSRRTLRHHYQHLILNDFLPRICDSEVLADVLDRQRRGRQRHYDASWDARIPDEFSFAAYRMGASLFRKEYSLNDALENPIRLLRDFSLNANLVGGRDIPPNWVIQWDRFLPYQGSTPQKAMRIDLSIVRPLKRLPVDDPDDRMRMFPFLTLLQGFDRGLPSGQSVADAMKEDVLVGDDPLWRYVLREAAESPNCGLHLGRVGSRIVAEVLVEQIALTSSSILSEASWVPTLPCVENEFRLSDLIAFSRSPMTADDWTARWRRPA